MENRQKKAPPPPPTPQLPPLSPQERFFLFSLFLKFAPGDQRRCWSGQFSVTEITKPGFCQRTHVAISGAAISVLQSGPTQFICTSILTYKCSYLTTISVPHVSWPFSSVFQWTFHWTYSSKIWYFFSLHFCFFPIYISVAWNIVLLICVPYKSSAQIFLHSADFSVTSLAGKSVFWFNLNSVSLLQR